MLCENSSICRAMATILYLLLLCTIVVAQYQVERTWLKSSEGKTHGRRSDFQNTHPDSKPLAHSHRAIRRNRRNTDGNMNLPIDDRVQRLFRRFADRLGPEDHSSELPRPAMRPERNNSRPETDRPQRPKWNQTGSEVNGSRPIGQRPGPEKRKQETKIRNGDDESDLSDENDLDIVIKIQIGRGHRRAQTSGGHHEAKTADRRSVIQSPAQDRKQSTK